MKWKDGWIAVQLRHRVIHRLPGRMRVHVPALREAAEGFRDTVDALLQGFELPKGFRSVEASYATGNLLICYDAKALAERDVLEWLFQIRRIARDILARFTEMDEDQTGRIERQLLDFFRAASERGARIDESFAVPDQVWH